MMPFYPSKVIIQFFKMSIRGGDDDGINIILKRFEKKEKKGGG
jgi:hypothetical protein